MEYWNIINLLDKTNNQPSQFRTKKVIKVNVVSCRIYTLNISC